MKRLISLVAAFLALSAIAQNLEDAEGGCGWVITDHTAKKSYRYNLTSLNHAAGDADTLSYQEGMGGTVFLNICGATTVQCEPSQSVCRRSALYTLVGYGTPASQNATALSLLGYTIDQGITLYYSQGYDCLNSLRHSTTVHVVCGKSAAYISEVTDDVSNECNIIVKIVAPAGCSVLVPYEKGSGESSKLSAGGLILILIAVAVVLYVGVGCVVNWKFRGATTAREIFPNTAFWAALPLLVKDGVLFIAHGFKKGDYTTV